LIYLSVLWGPSSAATSYGVSLHNHLIMSGRSDHCSNRFDANRSPDCALKVEVIKLMPCTLFFLSLFLHSLNFLIIATVWFLRHSKILTEIWNSHYLYTDSDRKEEWSCWIGKWDSSKDHSTAGVCWQEFPLKNFQQCKCLYYYYWCFLLILITRSGKKRKENRSLWNSEK
jgi:hypothetical protein